MILKTSYTVIKSEETGEWELHLSEMKSLKKIMSSDGLLEVMNEKHRLLNKDKQNGTD